MQVEEDCAAPQMILHAHEDVGTNRLKQWMARSDPLQCRVYRQQGFVEDDLAIFAPEAAETGLLAVANGDQVARHPAEAVQVAVRAGRFRVQPRLWGRTNEELLDDL